MLNIQEALDAMDPVQRLEMETGKIADDGRKHLFVAPAPAELPNDGVLDYIVVTSVYDTKDAGDRAVLLFGERELPILQVLCQHSAVFGVVLHQMMGLPGAEYSVNFDQATWNLERVSYAPLVSELNLALEQNKQVEAAGRTLHDVEREQYTRADGSVREQQGFHVAGTSPADDDSIADDDDR